MHDPGTTLIAPALLRQLRRLAVEGRPTACLGCGFEQGCSLHGCAAIRKALELLEGGGRDGQR